MGCSRLGSLLASGGDTTARQAVETALQEQIRFFDTANIYGQGSSELILGRILPRDGVEICTKAGFVTPAPLWALRLVKRGLRPVARRNVAGARQRAAGLRAKSYPQRFDPVSLARSLTGSLRRLRRERTDVFLLHNPPPDLAANAGLWRWVETELRRGRIGAFGVSCAGSATDLPWLDHPLLSAAQIPADSVAPLAGAFLADPRSQRLRIMVREIVGPGMHTPDAIDRGLRAVVEARRAGIAIMGMSSPAHVRATSEIYRGVMAVSKTQELG